MEVDEKKEEVKKESEESEAKKAEESEAKKAEESKEKEKPKKEEKSKPKPERRKICVSIQPPQISLQQMEQMITQGGKYDSDLINDLMAQTYAATIKWPKEVILQVRLEHIVKCVETGKWPVERNYPLGDHLLSNSRGASPDREASTPMSEASEPAFDEPTPVRRRGRQFVAEDTMDHSPKIRSLLTASQTSTVTPPKNTVALSLDAFLLESNQQNLAERCVWFC
jgi:hypothetical protein